MDETFGDPDLDGQVRFGSALYGPQRLDFFLAADIGKLGELAPHVPEPEPIEGDQEGWERSLVRSSILRADAIERALTEAVPGVKPRIEANLSGGVDSAGPGLGIEGEIIRLLVSDDPLGRVANLLQVGTSILLLKKWLETRTEKPVPISDGVAVIEATIALENDSGIRDSTLAFVSNVPPREFDYVGPRDAYVVGLRAKDELHVFLVGVYGGVARHDSWNLAELPARQEPPAHG